MWMNAYAMRGLTLRQLEERDRALLGPMQDEVLSALPDPRWYFPSEEWEFDAWIAGREAVGYFDGDVLAGFAVLTAARLRGDHSYARVLGEDPANTFDFHDVMVRPPYRGRGMHTRFLALFEETARALGGRAIYATVDPENEASWRNFEKAGYACVRIQPAYDGRMRRYYKLELAAFTQGSLIFPHR